MRKRGPNFTIYVFAMKCRQLEMTEDPRHYSSQQIEPSCKRVLESLKLRFTPIPKSRNQCILTRAINSKLLFLGTGAGGVDLNVRK